MSKIDYLSLDGRLLQLFLVVLEEKSVTVAAERLNITQSAVSHSLDKLRVIFDDALFIRAGRGITPSARAETIADDVRRLLSQLQDVTSSPAFIPQEADIQYTVAANDLQREFLLPDFYKRVSQQVRKFSLRIIPADLPNVDLLRRGECDFLIAPVAPDAQDIMQRRLVNDEMCCIYDGTVREPPKTLEEYREARHISLTFMEHLDREISKRYFGEINQLNIAVRVSNFSGIAGFLRGTDMITTLPRLMAQALMPEFSQADLPFNSKKLSFYLLWHKRHQADPTHHWLRTKFDDVVKEKLATTND